MLCSVTARSLYCCRPGASSLLGSSCLLHVLRTFISGAHLSLSSRPSTITFTVCRRFSHSQKMDLIGAIDQGTSSSRFLVFDIKTGNVVASHQMEITQYFPHPGWVEIDPNEIMDTVNECVSVTVDKLAKSEYSNLRIQAVGIANQRETTIVWDRETGKPLYNAIVWLDSRTAELSRTFSEKTPSKSKHEFRKRTGLPINPYFSALKLHWLLQNVESVKEAKEKGSLMFGNVDAWIMWNLTGRHVTDVTNASRTLLFDLKKVAWSQEMCNFFEVPSNILPDICSSAEIYGHIKSGPLKDVPVSGILGDQQAALVGHRCLRMGDTKNTYGTGTFMLCNVGCQPVFSENGMLSTVAFQFGSKSDVYYALEGSGSIGGNVIRFLRDNLSFFENAGDCEKLAKSVESSEGVVFVPCFTGLYSPYWDSTARGSIFGLTQFSGKGHITRAALEAVCYQSAEILEAIKMDLPNGSKIRSFKADGGMTKNVLFNQMQSNIIGMDFITSRCPETTALGAAMAAAIGAKLARIEDFADEESTSSTVYSPLLGKEERMNRLRIWRDAVQRSRNWVIERIE